MILYRFSPVLDESELRIALKYIDEKCHELVEVILGEILPVSGNIGYFCHYADEYTSLKKIQNELCRMDNSVHGKYFELKTPIHTDTSEYKFLYIRKPDPYRHHVGDIDFFVDADQFSSLKARVEQEQLHGARMIVRPDLEMIELFHPDYDVLAYITSHKY